jgi:Family of unknown function (DUF5681)
VTFVPGISGNPTGRRPGSKTKKQQLVEALFEGEVAEVARKAVELARAGNTDCIRLILDRVAPAPRGRRVRFRLLQVSSTDDLVRAVNCILKAVSSGTLTVEEGHALASAVELGGRIFEVAELGERIAALEARLV